MNNIITQICSWITITMHHHQTHQTLYLAHVVSNYPHSTHMMIEEYIWRPMATRYGGCLVRLLLCRLLAAGIGPSVLMDVFSVYVFVHLDIYIFFRGNRSSLLLTALFAPGACAVAVMVISSSEFQELRGSPVGTAGHDRHQARLSSKHPANSSCMVLVRRPLSFVFVDAEPKKHDDHHHHILRLDSLLRLRWLRLDMCCIIPSCCLVFAR